MTPSLVEVGAVGRPHGIRGEVRLIWYAESLDLLNGELWLQAGRLPARSARVESVRLREGSPLVRFAGCEDRNAAEALRGQTVLVAESALPPCEDDEVYLYELTGCEVRLEATGEVLGELSGVLFQGGGEQETWIILSPGGQEIYLPAVPEFVSSIDTEARCIRVTPPEGLLDIYLGTSGKAS